MPDCLSSSLCVWAFIFVKMLTRRANNLQRLPNIIQHLCYHYKCPLNKCPLTSKSPGRRLRLRSIQWGAPVFIEACVPFWPGFPKAAALSRNDREETPWTNKHDEFPMEKDCSEKSYRVRYLLADWSKTTQIFIRTFLTVS